MQPAICQGKTRQRLSNGKPYTEDMILFYMLSYKIVRQMFEAIQMSAKSSGFNKHEFEFSCTAELSKKKVL